MNQCDPCYLIIKRMSVLERNCFDSCIECINLPIMVQSINENKCINQFINVSMDSPTKHISCPSGSANITT